MENKISYEMIVSIVNRGYSDYVVNASREAGATGGTIVFARGTCNSQEKDVFMGVSIEPEKDIVLTLVKSEDKKRVMRAIIENTSVLDEYGHGICFSMPVNNVVGLKQPPKENIFKRVIIKKDKEQQKSNLKENTNSIAKPQELKNNNDDIKRSKEFDKKERKISKK